MLKNRLCAIYKRTFIVIIYYNFSIIIRLVFIYPIPVDSHAFNGFVHVMRKDENEMMWSIKKRQDGEE